MCEDATREAQEVSETTGIVALEPAAATSSSWSDDDERAGGRARAGGGRSRRRWVERRMGGRERL
jgi:hypothetical protein